MADTPKHPPMTFREALALIDDARADRSYCAAAGKHFAAPADLARARAIVDAGTAFIEAYQAAFRHGPKSLDGMLVHELEALGDAFESSFDKLRALERGESEGKP